jgi:transmembrane sensor
MSGGGKILPMPADPRLAQAARWQIRLAEAGLESMPEFELWLSEPQNRAAWEKVAGCWDYFAEVAAEPEMIAARQAALGDAFRHKASSALPVRRMAGIAAGLTLVLALALAGGGLWWSSLPDDYRTARGERRVITLSDGSRISLDSESEVTVRYRHGARELALLKGQARFDVAQDKSRPFSVQAGDRKVVATGTAFNIDLAGPRVLVTLIEGRVLVYDHKGGASEISRPQAVRREIALKAGEQLALAPAVPPVIAPVNLQQVTAWTAGQIMFENEALASVAERVNRYGATHIVIEDPAVASLRISGVFNAGDVAGVVDIVTQYLPVRAVRLDDGRLLLQPAAKKQAM